MQRNRLAILGWTLASCCFFQGELSAQNQLGSLEELNQQFGKLKFTFTQKMLTGLEPATAPQMEAAAKFYIYRLTDINAQTNEKQMGDYVKDFENMIAIATTAANAPKNRDLVSKLAPQLASRFQEVFAMDFGPNRLAVVNAAVLLPYAAKLRHDDLADYLAAVVANDKLNDAVRLYAADGLREYCPIKPLTKFDQPITKARLEIKERDAKRVDALIKFIGRPTPTEGPQEEIDGLRYLRRRAVGVLALTGVPAVTAMNGKVEGPVAETLLKVLAKKVLPEPSIQERLEAAIGVCYFNKFVEEYDPKIGVHQVGECLKDVFSEYKKDFPNLQQPAKDRKPPYFPWKQTSKRLELALAELVSNTAKTSSADSAKRIESIAKPMLQAIAVTQALQREAEFRAEVEKAKPTSKVLFKTSKGTMLELDWEAAAPAAGK